MRDQLEFIWLERVEEAASAALETTSQGLRTRSNRSWVRRAVIGGLWWAMTSHVYSFMPANAVLRCQSNRADRSSRAAADGAVGMNL